MRYRVGQAGAELRTSHHEVNILFALVPIVRKNVPFDCAGSPAIWFVSLGSNDPIVAAQLKNKIVNIHIPKTAGSSLRSNLCDDVRQLRGGNFGIIGILPPAGCDDYFGGLRASFAEHFPLIFKEGLQFVSGHYRYRDIADLLAPHRAEVTLVTFVRDPIWRTLSDYFYCVSDAHAARDAFVAEYPTFDDYMDVPGQMNKLQDYLCPDESASVNETLQSAIRNFDFIGVTENFENDFKGLMDGLELESAPRNRKNVNPNRSPILEAHAKYQDQLLSVLADEYVLYNGILEHRNLLS